MMQEDGVLCLKILVSRNILALKSFAIFMGGGLQFFFPLLQAKVTVGKPSLEPHAAASGSSGWLHRTEKWDKLPT